ncbi:MAG: GGDEF domain-containing protein [Candidatus Rokubacteria bacterium]|nr:GGDEF domain-containing protein [Candidatus Rokubacteria bacterium]
MKRALARLLPGGVLLLAATLLPSLGALRESLPALLPVYFYVVFGGGILLAWRFDRSRLVLALLVLALADRALLHLGPSAAAAVALLLPLDLAALCWLSERGLLTPRGRVKLLVLLLQALAVALISRPELAFVAAWLQYAFVESAWLSALGLPQPALLAFALALGLVTLRFIRHPTALESGSLWALAAAFLALLTGPVEPAFTLDLATAGLILVVSLVETSHGMAYGDELTGLAGRRALIEALLKHGDRYAIAMVDIDHFKRFNDEHGHDVGDQLLRMVGARLGDVGGGGRAYRYGGEEFAVLFPGKSAEEIIPYLEALRVGIAVSAFTVRGRRRPREKPDRPRAGAGRKKAAVTVSIGVAEAGRQHPTPEQVIAAADAALYRAKKAGRNRLGT